MRILITIIAFLCALEAGATEYFASPSGNDGNTGTSEAQAWTLPKALLTTGGGNVVTLLKGTYTGAFTISGVSGSAGNPLVIRAKEKGQAILTGSGSVGLQISTSYNISIEGIVVSNSTTHGIEILSHLVTLKDVVSRNNGQIGFKSVTTGVGTNTFIRTLAWGNGSTSSHHGYSIAGPSNIVMNAASITNAGNGLEFYSATLRQQENWLINFLEWGHTNTGVQIYGGTDDGSGTNPGTNRVFSSTIMDGLKASYGVLELSNNVFLPSIARPLNPIDPSATRVVTLREDYNFGTNTLVTGQGSHDNVTNIARLTLFPRLGKGQLWLIRSNPALTNSALSPFPAVDFWDRPQSYVQSVGAFAWRGKLAFDTRDLIANPYGYWQDFVPASTNFYASPSGNDGNDGLSAGSPKTLQGAVSLLSPGVTVNAASGLYSGTEIHAYNIEGDPDYPATIKSTAKWGAIITGSSGRGIDVWQTYELVIDGICVSNNVSDGIKIQSHRCKVTKSKIWGNGDEGIASNSAGSATNTFSFNDIENNGDTFLDHAIYFSGQSNLVYGNFCANNYQFGIHLYTGSTGKKNWENYIFANITLGHDRAAGGTFWSAMDDFSSGGQLPGTNHVFGNTFLDGITARLGTLDFSNNVVLPSANRPLNPIDPSLSQPVTLREDYNFGTNSTLVSGQGSHDVVSFNTPRSTLFPGISSRRFWLPANSPMRNVAFRALIPPVNWWGWKNVSSGDIGAVAYSEDLLADNRDLVTYGNQMWDQLWIIPPYKRLDWSTNIVGVPNGIPTYTKWCDANVSIPGTNRVIVADGITDDAPALQAALTLCPYGQYIQLPAGTIKCNSAISHVRDGVLLRGKGMGITTLKVGASMTDFITFGTYNEQGTQRTNIIDVMPGQTNTVWDSVNHLGSTFGGKGAIFKIWENDASVAGGFANASDQDGSADPVHNASGGGAPKNAAAAPLIRQMFVCTGTNTGDQVYFWPPSMFQFHANKARSQYLYQTSLNFAGMEDFSIDNNGQASVSIRMSQGYGSWIKGVQSTKAGSVHLWMQYCLNCTVQDCYTYDASAFAPNTGISLMLYSHVSGCLFRGNVFRKCYPGIEFDTGVSGNAFLYNYLLEPQGGLAPIDDHGRHNAFNLFEGNIAYGVVLDGYFGSSQYYTFFRNWFHGDSGPTSFGARKILNVDHFARDHNFVANELGGPMTNWVSEIISNGWNNAYAAIGRFGYPNMGNDTFTWTNSTSQATNYDSLDFYVKSNLTIHGNYTWDSNAVSWDPAITNRTFPKSYFRENNTASYPWWWTNGLGLQAASWPVIGPDVTPARTNLNPAALNYASLTYGSGTPALPPEATDEIQNIIRWFFFYMLPLRQ